MDERLEIEIKKYRSTTATLIRTAVETQMSEKDFVLRYCALPGARHAPSKGKKRYAFLKKWGHIKP